MAKGKKTWRHTRYGVNVRPRRQWQARGYYSDFTLGISVKEDERYEEEFIPIGKAYGGYTDEEMKQLNKRIKDLTVEKYGPTLGLIPDIIVELEFDDIQVNKRTKANYTLRLPRFKAIRWDLSPKDVDTLKDVERMYQQKIDKNRLKQAENPSFHFRSKSLKIRTVKLWLLISHYADQTKSGCHRDRQCRSGRDRSPHESIPTPSKFQCPYPSSPCKCCGHQWG
ncbi:MAG: hypothetical protein U5K69_02085 [Balneolaceae bacterium]|nr:hypothetical protein [Balneolaceae bacterium]